MLERLESLDFGSFLPDGREEDLRVVPGRLDDGRHQVLHYRLREPEGPGGGEEEEGGGRKEFFLKKPTFSPDFLIFFFFNQAQFMAKMKLSASPGRGKKDFTHQCKNYWDLFLAHYVTYYVQIYTTVL